MSGQSGDDKFSEKETTQRSEATLKRLLATPPQHKTKPKTAKVAKRRKEVVVPKMPEEM